MIIEGKTNLAEVMRIIQPWLGSSIYFPFLSKTQPYLLKNSTNDLINILVNKPMLFYVKKNTLTTNNSYMGLEDYSDSLLAIEDIFSLMILYNLPAYKQTEIEIHWIMCESSSMINKSIMISYLCFIDFFQDRNISNGNNSVGRLDYKKFEDLFSLFGGKEFVAVLTQDKRCKSVLSCILKIFPSFKKNKYITSVDEYCISKENLKDVYRTKCYVCDEVYSVVLHGNTKYTLGNDKYILPNEMLNTFDHDNKLYVELICQACVCVEDNIKNRPILVIGGKPKSSGEYNNAFLKIYNSVLIDENAVMQQSQNIIDRMQSNEKNNDAE
jgi:hypothetical protein